MKNKKEKLPYCHSLQNEIAITFAMLTLGIILLQIILSYVFLEEYYTSQKKKSLEDTYHYLNTLGEDISGDEDILERVIELCISRNISALIMDNKSDPVFLLVNDGGKLQKRLEYYLLNKETTGQVANSATFNQWKEGKGQYFIQMNKEQEQEYLEMWGVFDSGKIFILQLPMASIKDSVEVSNNFLMYVSLLGVGIGMAITLFASNQITKPIMNLAKQSQRMANLDFNARYEGSHNNEIGLLGDSMNHMSRNLEKTIAQLKTANMELVKDLDARNEAEERRSTFLSNVSHELKTPLALIQGYAEGLKEAVNQTEEDRNFYCEVIMDEAMKMNQLVQKLLTLNELESGVDKVIMERFNLVELIEGIIRANRLNLEQKKVQLNFVTPKPILFVWADEFKIEEVITNYVSNAFHHVKEEGRIEIKISELETGHVRVSVFNTGDPIPTEDIKEIWNKFYKVDKARTRSYGGSGIGLSIVAAIMDSLHQQYGVQNYNNGVEFWFDLEKEVSLEEEV